MEFFRLSGGARCYLSFCCGGDEERALERSEAEMLRGLGRLGELQKGVEKDSDSIPLRKNKKGLEKEETSYSVSVFLANETAFCPLLGKT